MKTSLSFLLFAICITEVPEDQNPHCFNPFHTTTVHLIIYLFCRLNTALEVGEENLALTGDNILKRQTNHCSSIGSPVKIREPFRFVS